MAYAVLQDMVDRFSLDEILIVADDENTGTPDSNRVASALADAEAEIDLYVGTRYDLPLPALLPARTTNLLKRFACDLAFNFLSKDSVGDSEAKQKAREEVIATLKLIASGKVVLAINTEDSDEDDVLDQSADTPEVTSAERLFTRSSMRGVL